MRIGIISDVHGDLDALENTLHQLKHHHNVSYVLSAGDLVGRGPEQNRVVEVHRQMDIIAVRGNHDEVYSGLTSENVAYLRSLPIDWQGTLGGLRFYMCHGKPKNNMWGMYRDHLSDTYLNMVLRSLRVDVMVTGHTHVPLLMQVEAGILFNPGSLYTFHNPRQTSRTYGVLDVPSLSFAWYASHTHEAVQPHSA